MADEQEQRLTRRFFKDLEQRIGGVRVEFIDGVDDAHPPALRSRGRSEEVDGLPGLVDRDYGPHHSLVVGSSLKNEEPAMGTRRDAARGGVGRIDVKAIGTLHGRRKGISMRKNEASHPVGERGLADSLRASDQPGMRNASAAIGIEQRRLGLAVTEQNSCFSRMNNRKRRLGLAAHADAAALFVLVVKNRSRSTDQIFAATFAGSSVASISTQRSGSLAAMRRYASRSC